MVAGPPANAVSRPAAEQTAAKRFFERSPMVTLLNVVVRAGPPRRRLTSRVTRARLTNGRNVSRSGSGDVQLFQREIQMRSWRKVNFRLELHTWKLGDLLRCKL